MKTIRLFYPDHRSGGLEAYHFGARLMRSILPDNPNQPWVEVPVAPPDAEMRPTTNGIYAEAEILAGVRAAYAAIDAEAPERIITAGGNCLVSFAPFDYLHGLYPDAGILWIDAHPDVSEPKDGYPNAHAMVLGSLMGCGAPGMTQLLRNAPFTGDRIFYVGLQGLHDYQRRFLEEMGVDFRIQTEFFESEARIREFLKRHPRVLVHFDIDVLDPRGFHSTYFANPEMTGDGSGGGRMTMEELGRVFSLINAESNVVGLTVAEYLPWDELRLHQTLAKLDIFSK